MAASVYTTTPQQASLRISTTSEDANDAVRFSDLAEGMAMQPRITTEICKPLMLLTTNC